MDEVAFDPDLMDVGGAADTIGGVPLESVLLSAAADDFFNPAMLENTAPLQDVVQRFQAGTFDPATASPTELAAAAQALGLEVPKDLPFMDAAPAVAPPFEPSPTGQGLAGAETPVFGTGPNAATLNQLETTLTDIDTAARSVEPRGVFLDTETNTLKTADGAPVSPQTTPDLWKAIGDKWDQLNALLKSPMGQALGVLGLGGVGVGLGRALAGTPPRIQAPTPTAPTPGVAAARAALTNALQGNAGPALSTGTVVPDLSRLGPGSSGGDDLARALALALAAQRNVADIGVGASARELQTQTAQAPGERTARMLALGQVPGLLDRSQATQMTNDPILAGITARLNDAVAGKVANPMLQQQFAKEESDLRNALYAQVGPGYETSSAGQSALSLMRQRQAALTSEDNRATIAAFSPIVLARQQFGEGVRQTGLNEDVALSSSFGRVPSASTLTQTNSIVSPMGVVGLGDAAAAARQADALNAQFALTNAQNRFQSGQNLANSVAGIFGTAAGSLGRSSPRVTRNPDNTITIG